MTLRWLFWHKQELTNSNGFFATGKQEMLVPNFESDIERLDWLLKEVKQLSKGQLTIKPQSAEEVELLIVTFGLLRITLEYASAIYQLMLV